MAAIDPQGEGIETPVLATARDLGDEGRGNASAPILGVDDEVDDERTIGGVIPGGFSDDEDCSDEGPAVPSANEGIFGRRTEGAVEGESELFRSLQECFSCRASRVRTASTGMS